MGSNPSEGDYNSAASVMKTDREYYGLPEDATEDQLADAKCKALAKADRSYYDLPEDATEDQLADARRKSVAAVKGVLEKYKNK